MKTTTDTFDCGTVQLQRGGTLKGAKIVYKTFGTLSPRRDNVIVYPTSYSAHHTDIEWLVDVRHGLDPSRYFIVIPNMFTNGLSTSPSNYDGVFPEVTAYDNVVQQRRLMNEVFGVERGPRRGRCISIRREDRRHGHIRHRTPPCPCGAPEVPPSPCSM